MNKLSFLGAAGLAVIFVGSAVAADFPSNQPAASFAPPFTWTGCYLGAHAGGAWERKDATDPVQLVQDNIGLGGAPGNTVGITTTRVSPSGAVIGGQIGCDYQFAPSFVVGVEAAASGATIKGSAQVGLPLGNLGETALVSVRTDFVPTLTARLGYAMDHWLFYGKGGVAWAGDKYSVTGTFLTNPFDFEGLDLRTGWTGGAGVEWAFAEDWSVRLEYDYYDFGRQTLNMNDAVNGLGSVSFKQSVQMVKLGVNFHVWGWQ